MRKDFAVVAGVRAGAQKQADLLGLARNYSNTLTRFLVGIEGPRAPTCNSPSWVPLFPPLRPRCYRRLRPLPARPLRRSFGYMDAPFRRYRYRFTAKDYLALSSAGHTTYQNTGANGEVETHL